MFTSPLAISTFAGAWARSVASVRCGCRGSLGPTRSGRPDLGRGRLDAVALFAEAPFAWSGPGCVRVAEGALEFTLDGKEKNGRRTGCRRRDAFVSVTDSLGYWEGVPKLTDRQGRQALYVRFGFLETLSSSAMVNVVPKVGDDGHEAGCRSWRGCNVWEATRKTNRCDSDRTCITTIQPSRDPSIPHFSETHSRPGGQDPSASSGSNLSPELRRLFATTTDYEA